MLHYFLHNPPQTQSQFPKVQSSQFTFAIDLLEKRMVNN